MSQAKIKIHLSQINTSVGDLFGNCQKILSEFRKAEENNCDLVVFCEMTVSGYPCQDLWQKKYFMENVEEKIVEITKATKGSNCAILLGAPTSSIGRFRKEIISNSAVLIEKGCVTRVCNKKALANYGVFDEKRYFEPELALSFIEFRGLTLAILICEDLWDSKNLFLLSEQVLDLVISINSSPFSANKKENRKEISRKFTKTLGKPLIYLNQVGAQDSLIFDGSSFVMDENGDISFKMRSFKEDSAMVRIEKDGNIEVDQNSINENDLADNYLEDKYSACILGIRDYVKKSGFKKVILGMSGGIDSALVATMANDALGNENIKLFALPSRYNSQTSMTDAQKCSDNLGVNLEVISIEDSFAAMLNSLNNSQGEITDLAQENIQSRIRGNILMGLSNNSGALLLSTGNKSELSCGYATLYGDMCGAFNPLKDLYKSEVFELAKWRNDTIPEISIYKKDKIIPLNIIEKPPTAELRPDQKDSDSLPEYEILDKILFSLIEEQKSVEEIIKMGFEEELVKKVVKLFYASEYKRQQSCIGPKISEMSFDKERRYPIVNKFWE